MLHISSSMETERLKLPGHSNKFVDAIKELIEYHFIKWASLVAQLVKNLTAMRETWVWSLGWADFWRRESLPTPVFWPGEFHGVAKSRTKLSDFHFHFQTLSPLGPWVREKKGGGKHLKTDDYPGRLSQKSEVMLCNCQRTCWEESQSCMKVSY